MVPSSRASFSSKAGHARLSQATGLIEMAKALRHRHLGANAPGQLVRGEVGKCLAFSPCFQNRDLSPRNHQAVGPEAILGIPLPNGKLGVVSFETAREHPVSPLSGTHT